MTALILVVRFVRCLVAANFGGGGGNDVLVGDSFKSSCAVLDDMGGATAAAGGVAPGGVAPPLTSFYDAAVTSSSQCDVTRSNGLTSSFGFTQEQVACVCEVRARVCGYTPQVSNENVDSWDFN